MAYSVNKFLRLVWRGQNGLVGKGQEEAGESEKLHFVPTQVESCAI